MSGIMTTRLKKRGMQLNPVAADPQNPQQLATGMVPGSSTRVPTEPAPIPQTMENDRTTPEEIVTLD